MQDIIKWMLLLILFMPVFYYAFRQKKWYLYLSCAFLGILPDEFALELSASLPLLTVERILILIMLGFWIFNQWKKREFRFPVSLAIYFGINMLISVVNLRFGIANELKNILVMVSEKILLILMITDFIDDRKDLDQCLDAMILSCVALSMIGIIQTIFEYDPTSVLALVPTRYDDSLTLRMGIIRAFGTSNAIIFGCYCAFMAVLIFYRLERTGKQRYALAFGLAIVAMICTLSRSSWLCAVGIAGLIFIFRPKKFVKRIWTSVVCTVLICAILCLCNAQFLDAMAETGKSSLNTVLSVLHIDIPGIDIGMDEGEDDFQLDISDEFGDNRNDPTRSRMVEWTAVSYMIDEGHALFGYGYNAFLRGKLQYFYPQFGFWTTATTLDVGLIAVITESGFVGFAALLALLGYVFIVAFQKRGDNGTFNFYKLMLYMIPMYLILNFMAAFTGGFWVLIGLFYASRKLDKKGLTDDGIAAPDNKWLV